MKRILLLSALSFSVLIVFAQAKFDKVFQMGQYAPNRALVEKNGKYGFIDCDQKLLLKPVYDTIYRFNDLHPNWALVKKNGKFGFIDIDCKEVVTPKYDKIHNFGVLDPNFALVEHKGMKGLINTDGLICCKPIYDQIKNEDGKFIGIKNGKTQVIEIKSKMKR